MGAQRIYENPEEHRDEYDNGMAASQRAVLEETLGEQVLER